MDMVSARWTKAFVAGLFILAAAAAGLRAGEAPETVASVLVSAVTTLDRTEPRRIIGTVSGSETLAVVARISGTLESAPFREGGLVKKGDLLFTIEDTTYKARLAIAKAVVGQAEAELELAKKDLQRSQELLREGATTQSAFDTFFYKAELGSARLEEAKANVVLAEEDLRHTRIVAETGGRIGEKTFTEGNFVTPSSGTLATVVRFDPAYVKFSVREADFFRYFENHETPRDAAIELTLANGEPFEGKVSVDLVDNLVDARTDTITIRLSCENPKSELLPGGFVTVRLARRFDEPVPAVNVQALMLDAKTHYVFVLDADNVVERREVVLGEQVHKLQAVRSGLAVGERVVVGGLNKVRPGMKVDPVTE